MSLQIAWTVDFLDDPADGLEFRYWSGFGELQIGDTVYQGSNGVIRIEPPREESGSAVRMTVEMDATDPAVRQQLRQDIGPLRVRVNWIYSTEELVDDSYTINALSGADRTSSGQIYVGTNANQIALNTVEKIRFTNDGGYSGIGPDISYYAKRVGNYLRIYDTHANAEQAPNDIATNHTGQINLGSGGTQANIVISVIRLHAQGRIWNLSGKSFEGRLSSPVLSGSTYVVDIESIISDIDRGRVLNWSNDVQQGRYPEDKGMEYIADYAEGISTKWPP